MSNTRDTGFLRNAIQVTDQGVTFVSGSTTLMSISSSGAVTTTGVISGSNALSASFSLNSALLNGIGSVGFATTGALLEISSSQQQISSSQQQISASLLNVVANYATTGSNSFRANQSITGSLVVSSTITAQTLVVQTVTSSIVYSSGSNLFGSALGDRQTFTGSVNITGSLALAGNITGNAITLTGALTGTSATFSSSVTAGGKITATGGNYIYALEANAGTTSGQSYGLIVRGGTTSTDDAMVVYNAVGSSTFFRISGTGAATFSSSVTAGNTSTFSNASGLSAIFSNGGGASNFNSIELRGGTVGSAVNWQISKDNTLGNGFEIAASTTAGGTTYASPVFKIASTGAATFSSSVTMDYNFNGSSWFTAKNTNAGSGAAAGLLMTNNGGDLAAISLLSSTNSPANALYIRTLSTNSLVLGTNSGTNLTIVNGGAATFSSTVTTGDALYVGSGGSGGGIWTWGNTESYIFSPASKSLNLTVDNGLTKGLRIISSTGAATFSSTITATGATFNGDINMNGGEFNSNGRILFDAGPGNGFLFRCDNVAVTAMTITSAGIVQIGGTNAAPWNITSGTVSQITINDTTNGFPFIIAKNDNLLAIFNRVGSNGTILEFKYNANVVGSISTNANSLPSDLNFKKDITDMSLGLNLITKLRPVHYRHKFDNETEALSNGIIAQELEQSLLECGVEKNSLLMLQHKPNEKEGESQYWLDYTKIIPVLTKAIQELKAENDSLKSRVEVLETK